MNQPKRVVIRTLTIEDVLQDGPIDMHGVHFDSHVTAQIRQVGSGDMEIMDMNDRSISIAIPNVAFPFTLDKQHFKDTRSSLYEAFLKAVDLKALEIAAKTPDEKWDYDEVEDDES